MIERTFMACEANNELGRMFGPFKSAGEAEKHSADLGWKWVVAYTHAVEDGKITGVIKRYYQPGNPAVAEEIFAPRRTPEQIAQLKADLSTTNPCEVVSPNLVGFEQILLSGEEFSFFEEYERQMANHDDQI